jgi:hypothetical protein
MMGGWIHLASGFFEGGVTSVQKLMGKAFEISFSAADMPQFAFIGPMAGTMFSKMVMKVYGNYTAKRAQGDGSGADGWLQHIPENQRALWLQVIDTDVKVDAQLQQTADREWREFLREANLVPAEDTLPQGFAASGLAQAPFSNAYRRGGAQGGGKSSSSKRKFAEYSQEDEKKSSSLNQFDPAESVKRRVRRAVEASCEGEADEKAAAVDRALESVDNSNVVDIWCAQMRKDMRALAHKNPDFTSNPDRFPNLK